MTKTQGYVTLLLLGILAGFLGWQTFRPDAQRRWDYKVLAFVPEGSTTAAAARTGEAAAAPAMIKVDEKELKLLGDEGWELVGTFIEHETAYPNFGNSQYVTGLQPNIRPQRAVLVLKRPALPNQ